VKTCGAGHIAAARQQLEHNAHNLEIAGYLGSAHKRAVAAAGP
jgi:hypothetical protein